MLRENSTSTASGVVVGGGAYFNRLQQIGLVNGNANKNKNKKKHTKNSSRNEYDEKNEKNDESVNGVYRVPSVPRRQVITTTNGTRLDLSYLTPKILIGSGPTDGKISRLYKNSIYDIIGYLNDKHGANNWCIYNLRAEKLGYTEDLINDSNGILKNFKFLDHTVMPFIKFLECVKSIEEYINSNSKKIVFIHCKFGKGRTGTIASGYLMYKYNIKLSDALNLFKIRRNFYDVTVSVPSQLRYLKYFRKMLDNKEIMFNKYNKIIKQNHKILFKSLNFKKLKFNYKDFNIKLFNDLNEIFIRFKIQNFSSKEGNEISEIYTDTIKLKDIDCDTDTDIDITADLSSLSKNYFNLQDYSICIEFLNDSRIIAYGNFWFNPINEILNDDNFEDNDENTSIEKSSEIKWDAIDGYKGTKKKGLKLFESVCVNYSII